MLAIDPVGLLVTVLVTAALIPGRLKLLRAFGAVVLGESCKLLTALMLSGTVVQATMGGALSRYVLVGADPMLAGLTGAGLTVVAGLLVNRSFAAACAICSVLTVAGLLLRW